jgi:hypothetical protein
MREVGQGPDNLPVEKLGASNNNNNIKKTLEALRKI